MMKMKTERDITRCLSNMRRSLSTASKKICTPTHPSTRLVDKSKDRREPSRVQTTDKFDSLERKLKVIKEQLVEIESIPTQKQT